MAKAEPSLSSVDTRSVEQSEEDENGKLTAGVRGLEFGWEGIRRVARVGAGGIGGFLEGHAQEIVGMVVHGEIRGGWCAERIPAHCCVQSEGSFWDRAEGIEQGRRERNWAGWKSLAGTGRGRGRRRRSRDVGKREVRRGGTTSLCIFVDERRKWRRGRKLNLFYLFISP